MLCDMLCDIGESKVGFGVDGVTAIMSAPAGGGAEEQAALAFLRQEGVERIVQVKEELVVALNPQTLLPSGDWRSRPARSGKRRWRARRFRLRRWLKADRARF